MLTGTVWQRSHASSYQHVQFLPFGGAIWGRWERERAVRSAAAAAARCSCFLLSVDFGPYCAVYQTVLYGTVCEVVSQCGRKCVRLEKPLASQSTW